MKVSLILEDLGAGAQVVYASNNPDEALREYKTRHTAGKLALVINPRIDFHRKAPKVLATPAPAPRRKRELI